MSTLHLAARERHIRRVKDGIRLIVLYYENKYNRYSYSVVKGIYHYYLLISKPLTILTPFTTYLSIPAIKF